MNHPKEDHHLNRQTGLGFTLVEMLLVLVILSTLAAIIYPNMAKHGLRARITATKMQIQVLRTALSQFEMDNDHYPQQWPARIGAATTRLQELAWLVPRKEGGPQGCVGPGFHLRMSRQT